MWKVDVGEMDIDEEEKKVIRKKGMDMDIGMVENDLDEGFAMTWEEVKGFIGQA